MRRQQPPWNPSRKDRFIMLTIIVIAGNVVMKPVTAKNLYMQGIYLDGLAYYEESQRKYEKALLFDPGLTDALYALALSYEETSKENKSLAYCARVLSRHPDHFQCYDLLARAHFRKRDFKALIQAIKPLLTMTVPKEEALTLKLLAASYEKTGDAESAETVWRKILILQPNDGLAKSKLNETR